MATTQGKEYTRDTIRANAIIVGRELRTEWRGKKHGGYNIYEDDKIVVSVDTYVPNIDISIKRGGKKLEEVYDADYFGRIYTFHPGRWQDYLAEIAHKALETVRERMEKGRAARQAEQEKRFGPIDDSDLFPEVAA